MPPPSSSSLDLRCPDDGHVLQANHDLPVPFASCRHCDGLWFTREAMESEERPMLPPMNGPLRTSRQPNVTRACPQCATKMNAEAVGEAVIDVCGSCGGIWLDPGEYRAARSRSVRRRIEREMPSLRQSSSRVGRFLGGVLDAIGEQWIEDDPTTFDPREVVPRQRKRR